MARAGKWLCPILFGVAFGCSGGEGSEDTASPEGSGGGVPTVATGGTAGGVEPGAGGASTGGSLGEGGEGASETGAGGAPSGGDTGSGGTEPREPGTCPAPSVEPGNETPTVTITVEVDAPGQQITLMGGDMERSAGYLDNASNSQEIADWLYKDIDFGFCRVSYDRKQELTEGNPDFSFYSQPIAAMKLVRAARPDVQFWATLKSDYDGYGSVNNLPDWIYTGGGYNGGSYDPTQLNAAKYGRFLADYLKLMHDSGVTISVIEVSKEWGQVLDPERERQTIDALTTLLDTGPYAGVPVPKFAAHGGWGVAGTTNFVNKAASIGSLGIYAGVSAHSYDNPSETQWGTLITAAGAGGKPVWHTESTIGGGGPTAGAEPDFGKLITELSRHAGWYRQGLAGEMFFENWSRGVTTETRVVYFTNGKAGVRLRGYYVMQRFANNAANGTYIPTSVSGTEAVETMAFRRGNQLIVWAINRSDEPLLSEHLVQGAALHGGCTDRLAWEESSPITGDSDTLAPTTSTTFRSILEPNSLSSFVFELE